MVLLNWYLVLAVGSVNEYLWCDHPHEVPTIHMKYLPHDSFIYLFIFSLKIKLGIFPEFWFWTAIRVEKGSRS